MTATDELRELLTERGAKWFEYNGRVVIGVDEPATVASFKDYDGLLLGMMYTCCTPERAVEATLGRGTCHDSNNRFNAWQCSECGATMLLMLDDCGEPTYSVDGVADVPKYCPNCGRKVVLHE